VPAPHVEPPDLTRIFFKPGSASIEPGSRAELRRAIAGLRDGERALVVGHADSAGKSDSNELLAQKRADTVARELRRAAVGAGSVEVAIAAASHPLASNATADGRKENRRVDLILQRR
ncbi:MAG: OmpA family protein, partial [Myxococcaceae bacterium]|nr:OmpA family protein [Myxococcaceae bacterium]